MRHFNNPDIAGGGVEPMKVCADVVDLKNSNFENA